MASNIELVQQVYAAIGAGDFPEVFARMTDDVEMHLPGPPEIPFAGTYRGHDGVGRLFGAIGEAADIERFEPREFISDGDQVVALGIEELRAKATGRPWKTEWAMVWTIRDGKVSRVREFHQTDAIAWAFR